VQFLLNGRNILAGNIKGDVYMLRVEAHKPLRVQIAKLVEAMDRIWDVKHACFDSLSTWGMACQGRIFKFWKRKDIYRVMNDQDEELKMSDIGNLEYYLIDTYIMTLPNTEVFCYYLRRSDHTLSFPTSSPMWPYFSPIILSTSFSVTTKNTW
jgi:hypothetical protein